MTPKRWAGLTAAALFATTLAGCATLHVYSFAERGADVARYRTYNWAVEKPQTTGDPRLDNNPFFNDRVHAAIEKELAKRGLEKTAAGEAQLLLHYHASMTQEVDLGAADADLAICSTCTPTVYDAGTLLIDLVDSRTEKLLWRGWAEGGLNDAIDSQDMMEARIDETVRRIIEKLPSKS
jgi:Domain of unknown function (DUF4136)